MMKTIEINQAERIEIQQEIAALTADIKGFNDKIDNTPGLAQSSIDSLERRIERARKERNRLRDLI